ncbi:hypothetical protein Zmor_017463 [Zophobas morio]|uniref:Endonuclease-reverse transcriptase n=1 Tax=Zophobas morio TaxID=2755281 RepID=A0AA38ICA3_9CUCU|nr:hypothetical protein Zmor_017463 [Zophobas morio]
MKSSRISKDTKLLVYKTAIRSVVIYAAETISLTSESEEKMRRFERKIVRRIMEMKKIQDQKYRILMNHEIEDIIKGEDIVRAIKARRIRWYGHLKRMEKNKHARKISEWKPGNNIKRKTKNQVGESSKKGFVKARYSRQVEENPGPDTVERNSRASENVQAIVNSEEEMVD